MRFLILSFMLFLSGTATLVADSVNDPEQKQATYISEFLKMYSGRKNLTEFLRQTSRSFSSDICVVGDATTVALLETWLELVGEVRGLPREELHSVARFSECPLTHKDIYLYFREFDGPMERSLIEEDHKFFALASGDPSKSWFPPVEDILGQAYSSFKFGRIWEGGYVKVADATLARSESGFQQVLFRQLVLEEIFHATTFALDVIISRGEPSFSILHEPAYLRFQGSMGEGGFSGLKEYFEVASSGLCKFDIFVLVALKEFQAGNLTKDVEHHLRNELSRMMVVSEIIHSDIRFNEITADC